MLESTLGFFIGVGFVAFFAHWGRPMEWNEDVTIRAAVFEQIGRLCSSWAAFEAYTEIAIVGITEVDPWSSPTLSMGVERMWKHLIREAPKKHGPDEITVLQEINADFVLVKEDRDIVIHGYITAVASDFKRDGLKYFTEIFSAPPSWTVYRGPNAGKRFPLSLEAVQIITNNVEKLSERIKAFNHRHGYKEFAFPEELAQGEWPKPL